MATPITKVQQDYLDRLICERLSSDQDNLTRVGDFDNYKNPQLVSTLQNEANEQDENGEVAFYVVSRLSLSYWEEISTMKSQGLRHF